MPERILITGASGLLGSAFIDLFSDKADLTLLSHTSAGMKQVDLTDNSALESLKDLDWNVLINCAAYRDPDFCEDNRESAFRLNADVPEALARLAAERDALMVQISTDYVFGGSVAPYSESDDICPVNSYGESKAAGEAAVRKECPKSIIIRIPVLYGEPSSEIGSPFLEGAIEAVTSASVREMDDCIVRRPTCITDVAAATAHIISSGFKGTIHVSAEEKTTNYGWAAFIAECMGIEPTSAITRMTAPLNRKAERPRDSSLDISLLKSIGAPVPRPFIQVIPSLNIIKT